MSIFDNETPCAQCPYRKDAPLKLWDRVEFENLLEQDADPIRGHVFGCHKHRHQPKRERRPCVGWLLDQKKRGIPSIQLRLMLMKSEVARKHFARIHSKGLKLFRSIQAMCRANGVG